MRRFRILRVPKLAKSVDTVGKSTVEIRAGSEVRPSAPLNCRANKPPKGGFCAWNLPTAITYPLYCIDTFLIPVKPDIPDVLLIPI